MSARPAVSVVVPTFDRRRQLARTLEALAAERPVDGGFEVIVVSDGSADGTDEYLESDEVPLPVVAVTQPNAGPGAARNRGIERARGALIVFIDDDVVPQDDLLAVHQRSHERPDDDLVVIGPMNTPSDAVLSPWVRWEQAMLYKQYDAMNRGEWSVTARQFYTGNASVGRDHLLAVGGFDPSLRRAEDVELAYRLACRGMRFAFEPGAVVLHYAERSFRAWRRAVCAYGRNDVIFARDRGQAWLLDAISHEFHARHALVRHLASACLPRPRLAAVVTEALALLARGVGLLPRSERSERLCSAALSAVYNLTYYRGMADELGSGRQLMARFAAAHE